MPVLIKSKSLFLVFVISLTAQISNSAVPVFQHFDDIPALKSKYIKSIIEDKYGYIWIGTTKGVYQFKNGDIKSLPDHILSDNIDVQDLFVDDKNQLWIGTKSKGLLTYHNGTIRKIESHKFPIKTITKIFKSSDNQLWIASNQGLFTVSKNKEIIRHEVNLTSTILDDKVTALDESHSGQLLVGGIGVFHAIDLQKKTLSSITLEKNEQIHDIHVDHENAVWIASSEKLRKYNPNLNQFVNTPTLAHASRILSLQQLENYLWVASIDGGIYKIDIPSNKISQYSHDVSHDFSLSENHIREIFISSKNHLWVGNFSGGLSMFDLDQLDFGFETNTNGSISCLHNSKITAVSLDKDTVWLGSEHGLIKYDPILSKCKVIKADVIKNNFTVYSINKDAEFIWLSTSIGLLKYSTSLDSILPVTTTNQFLVAFFSVKTSDNHFIIGTDTGLFEYSTLTESYTRYQANNERFLSKPFIEYVTYINNEMLLPTSLGLLFLNNDNKLEQYPGTLEQLNNKEITGIHVNNKNELFVSVRNEGLYYFDSNQALKHHYFDEDIFSASNDISQIQSPDNSDVIWLGSKKGLIYLNIQTNEKHLFSGTSKNNYLSLFRSSFSHKNKILFAGDSGFVYFDATQINIKNRDLPLLISQLSLANIPVNPNEKTQSGFKLDSSIEETKKLRFGHLDKLIKLEFNNLDFYNRNAIRYAYKLEPAVPDWIELSARDNNLTFTQLEAGNYELSIRTTNQDQVWSDQIKSVEIQIAPAPWLSWWAYLIYILTLISLMFLYIKQKTRSQIKLNEYLKSQVKKQTRHIENQKTELENLIERKDEIFSNVSHEFRTPITLIQGPVSELSKQEKNQQKIKMLEMVERNSKRLLRLVNQMLELSKSVEKKSF